MADLNDKSDSEIAPAPQGEPEIKPAGDQPAAIHHEEPAPSKPERLGLPQGAFMAYRKRGGPKIASREIVVYPDGRVSFGGPDESKEVYARAGRKLNDGQIMRLRRTLDHINFFRMSSAPGDQPPDAFAHEIVARRGSRSNYVQVFDGSIPDALTPLLQQLSALMPKE